MSVYSYPPQPENSNKGIILPSRAFKNKVVKVTGAILFFLIIYLLLIIAACGLAVLCAYLGIHLIIAFPKFITLMIGLGMMGLGLMVIYFLLKFLFTKNVVDRSKLVEIKAVNHPKLFDFIKKLTRETETPFPKKIYLSADVNACVFYDTSFWSMFLPVKKNLQIGLGLVNSVNLSEFKAILAHEFGHFSQRSMKFGSYVYNVNKVIHNMLFDNEGYKNMLQGWASASSYFAIFANLTIWIVSGIQFIMQKVYIVVNKSYLGLSRQMEFHADRVAAYVAGSDHLITSLQRMEPASVCYDKLLNSYNFWISENLKPDNIYTHHTEVMNHFSRNFNIPVENGLMQINLASNANCLTNSRIIVKDQWSSHPSTKDRIESLQHVKIKTKTITESAWNIFDNVEQIQQQLSNKIFEQVKFSNDPAILDLKIFCEKYYNEFEKNSLNKVYEGYYDDRNITEFDHAAIITETIADIDFSELFDNNVKTLPKRIRDLNQDIATLDMVMQENSTIKTFDFDGKKYKKENASEISKLLKKELAQCDIELKECDLKIFRFFHNKASTVEEANHLISGFSNLIDLSKEAEKDYQNYHEIIETIRPIYIRKMSFEEARSIIRSVKIKETIIRSRLRQMLTEDAYTSILDEKNKPVLDKYLAKEWEYFMEPSFLNSALDLFVKSLNIYMYLASQRVFKYKKELLDFQYSLIK